MSQINSNIGYHQTLTLAKGKNTGLIALNGFYNGIRISHKILSNADLSKHTKKNYSQVIREIKANHGILYIYKDRIRKASEIYIKRRGSRKGDWILEIFTTPKEAKKEFEKLKKTKGPHQVIKMKMLIGNRTYKWEREVK